MAWLTGWTYRKTITLSRASGAVSNYQMKLLVGESAGAAGEDVDCNSHCQTDFDDLRFTNAAGTVLDYWIESITGTTPNQLAIVWIEFDSIGTGATTFYMYYGNAAATAVSSGANTFITFDDFERGSDGDTVGGSWTEVAAHCHISTEQDIGNVAGYTGTRAMKLIGDSSVQPMASIPVAPSANIAIRWRTYKEDAAFLEILHGDGDHAVVLYAETSEQIDYYDGHTKDTGKDCAADAWDLWELTTFNWTTNTFTLTFNGASVTGLTTYATASYANIVRFAAPLTTGQDVWIDDFIVRNWVATEPAWGSWGSEVAIWPHTFLGVAEPAAVLGIANAQIDEVLGVS